jgi:hypothetical protein
VIALVRVYARKARRWLVDRWDLRRRLRLMRAELIEARHHLDAYKAECSVHKRRAERYQQLAVRTAAGNPKAMDAVLWQMQSDEIADLDEIDSPRSAP